jgi:hypothetical protein
MCGKQSRRSHRMRIGHGLLCGALACGMAAAAQAAPALFSASFIMHAFGNDITTGTAPPSTSSTFVAMPFGHRCYVYGPCGASAYSEGAPATGSGTLVVGSGSPASIALPEAAFGVAVTGSWGYYSEPHYVTVTYATFVNAAAKFFAGGGPAAGLGQKTKTGMGQNAGTWIIHEGANAFGGVMGLLGQLGARVEFVGFGGSYAGTGSWNMIRALGRVPYAEPTAYKASVPTNWLNPHVTSNTYVNQTRGTTFKLRVRGSGTPWTTGSVTLYAAAGVYTTILHRAGYDSTTPSGARNIQLVTPALTHWIGPGSESHTGHIGILKLHIAPEPGAWLSLALGLGLLLGLRRVTGRF